MRYLSVCSGIEAASVAWHPLGWEPVAFAEVEAFPCALLDHHYPHVPNWGDITKFKEWPDAAIDVLVGGTPCQSFSVAGLRAGMADPRGNLALTFLAIADRYRPEWVVWENVPGVLSSNGGRDFGAFVGGLGQLGYGWAYRILDAQYVRVDGFERAVPQRRRRVFLVGHLGDWRRAAAVLFERESLQGHPAPRRQPGERPAPTISSRPTGGGGLGTDFDCDGGLIAAVSDPVCANEARTYTHEGANNFRLRNVVTQAVATTLTRGADSAGKGGYAGRRQEDDVNIVVTQAVANPLTARMVKGVNTTMDEGQTMVAHALRADGFDASEDGTGCGTPLVYSAMPMNSGKDYTVRPTEVAQPLMAAGPGLGDQGGDYVQQGWAVRRLLPVECERLQGFPDGYTDVPYRGKGAADGPRYKALGNSMAVNCMCWLGLRIGHVAGLEDGKS
jgi:DNA (cytosine-5)-methyltransferase 1